MFCKNLRYYRLKSGLSKKQLAEACGISPMAITHYENGNRKPDMGVMKKLAETLGVRVSDFLAVRNQNLVFHHGEFRKSSKLTHAQQDLICESVEAYFSRFFTAVELLGGEVLPEPPRNHALPLTGDVELDSLAMRRHFGLAESGPVDDLIGILENRGIPVYLLDFDQASFSGMNGTVNQRPYIVVNGQMTPERIRSTIVHEMAHFVFDWPETMEEKGAERLATAISGAFLLPKVDALRELGVRRRSITGDMELVCREYGISMLLLTKRANVTGIVSDSAAKSFYIKASSMGWRKNEPSRIAAERPHLFEQFVYRAVAEDEISIQRGAELLHVAYNAVAVQCRSYGE